MPGKWFISLTDEVSRNSSLRSTTGLYKACSKGDCYAPAAGTATPWPRSWGCLQRQSMSSILDGRKAKPQSDSNTMISSRDKLASAKKRSLTAVRALRTVPPRRCPAPSVWTPHSLGTTLSFTGVARTRVRSGSPDAGKLHVRQIWGTHMLAIISTPFPGVFTQFCSELRDFYRVGGLGKRIPAKEVVWPEPKLRFHASDLETAPVLAQTSGFGRKSPQNYRQNVSEELTSLRQRGGGGFGLPLTHKGWGEGRPSW